MEADAGENEPELDVKKREKGRSRRPKKMDPTSTQAAAVSDETVLDYAAQDGGSVDQVRRPIATTQHQRKVVEYGDNESDLGNEIGIGDTPSLTCAMPHFLWPQLAPDQV